ncbi:MAG: hypothetical protein ACFFCU_06650 [Promethearchaeota archaeon]
MRDIFRWIKSHVSIINDLGSLKWVFILLIFLHFFIGAIFPPLATSDLERNLFYGRAFWQHGFRIYDLTPLEIDPLYDVRDPLSGEYSYPNTTYDYPTVQLLFWAGISFFPISSVIAKWIMSCVDIFNFFSISFIIKSLNGEDTRKRISEWGFSISYLFFSIPFSAIEGQTTAITVMFLLLPLLLHSKYKILSYLSIGIGFHWKYISLILLPYLLIIDYVENKQVLFGFLTVITSMIFLSFPLLFSQFVLRYFSSFGNLELYSGQIPSNPLYLFYPSISSLLSSLLLILAILYWLGILPQIDMSNINIHGVLERVYWFPFILLLSFLKIYATAFPWYWMWFYPCLIILPRKIRSLFAVLLGVTFAIGLLDFVQMTVGFKTLIEHFF